MPRGRTLLAALTGLVLTGCGSPAAPAGQHTPAPPSVERTPTGPPSATATQQEDPMRIRITIGDQRFAATLTDSAASRDLVAQLPLTIDLRDHGSVEKTGPLPVPLSLDGQPGGADPDVGDVGYYAPGNDVVLYYGDQSYHDGIVILGRLHDAAAESIAAMDGSVTATIDAAGGRRTMGTRGG